MQWNPDCYHQFQKERFAPFEDLLRLVAVRPGLDAIDLGCGTGELTKRLADALPESNVLGIDNSQEMLQKAEAVAGPNLRFELKSIEAVSGQWDLVWSHAALQWVDDHSALIPRLFALLKSGGQIAVQLPSNHNHISHATLREIAMEPQFRDSFGGWMRKSPVLQIDQYGELLYRSGGSEITVFEKAYAHVLESSEAVLNWLRGTALLPYLERLPESLRPDFLAECSRRFKVIWPETPVFYPFRRILFSARKP